MSDDIFLQVLESNSIDLTVISEDKIQLTINPEESIQLVIKEGPAGLNAITDETACTISGILKGDGSHVLAAIENQDYISLNFADENYEPKNANIQAHIADKNNPHETTKAQVGLGNVSNDAQLKISSNLSDLLDAASSRNNLGLGSAATQDSSAFDPAGAASTAEENAQIYTETYAVHTVSATAPISSTGGLNPTIGIQKSDSSHDGYLSASDWSTFNNKQSALGFTPENASNKGQPNGYAPLDASSKVPVLNLPAFSVDALTFQGFYDASSGVYPSSPKKGFYWVISVGGVISSVIYRVNDWLTYNGSSWNKVDNYQLITSVNNQTGIVTINAISQLTGDVTAGPASNSESKAATVVSVGGSTASSIHSAELLANAATNLSTANSIVKRDSSGNFYAGTITASLDGNSTSANSAINFTGSLNGDVTGTQSATIVSKLNGNIIPDSALIIGTNSSGQIIDATNTTLSNNTTGTSSNLSGTPALPNGTTATTQISGDNSNKIATTAYVDEFSNTLLPQTIFNEYNLIQKEPTGFPDASQTIISFNDSLRQFSIIPSNSSYDVFVKGTKLTISTIKTSIITNATGLYYFYFDSLGNLNVTNTFSSSLILDYAIIAIIYWNQDTGSRIYFANERHGCVMDGMTHAYLHTVFGARFISGGALQNFSVDGIGNIDADAQFTSDSGSIRDEDLLISFIAQSQIPILYRQGTAWRKKLGDSFPVIYSGTAGYTGTNGLLAYNLLSGGNWSLSQVTNNQYVLVHIYATNDIDNPVVGAQGINVYNSISSARTGAINEIHSFDSLPFSEFVALGSVIFQTSTGYTNAPKARIRSTDTGSNYVDFRGTQSYTPSGSVIQSHSLLSNLSNDDHLQYLTEARGDARYITTISVNAPITNTNNTIGISAASSSNSGSMSSSDKSKLDGIQNGATQNSTDAFLLSRSNHTGTQAVSTITGLSNVATTGSYSDLTNAPVSTLGQINTALVPSTLNLTSSGSITTNQISNYNFVTILLNGNSTLDNFTTALNGQKLILRILQNNTGNNSLTVNSSYWNLGSDIVSFSIATAANSMTYVGCIFNAVSNKWDIVSIMKGY